MQARCSADLSCTSSGTTPASRQTVLVYPGDGGDLLLSLGHDRSSGVSSIGWKARPQPPVVSGYALYQGAIASSGDPNLATLGGIVCAGKFAAAPPETPVAASDATTPALGTARYFLVGHQPVLAGAQPPLGRQGGGTLRPLPPACP